MAFQISPGVNVTEFDLTTIIPAVATTEAGIAGVFRWGPTDTRVLIDNELTLVNRFGKPTNHNPETFFTAASYLAYSNQLWVVRVADANTFNAVANTGAPAANTSIGNEEEYLNATIDANNLYIAKYVGALGNSLKISVCDSANAFSNTISSGNGQAVATISYTVGSNSVTVSVTSEVVGDESNTTSLAETTADAMINALTVGDKLACGNSTIGFQYAVVTALANSTVSSNVYDANTGNTIAVAAGTISLASKYRLAANVSATSMTRYWGHFDVVDKAPGTSTYAQARGGAADEIHVVVIDEDGNFAGTPGTILEVFPALSRATDAKGPTGETIYYKNVLNDQSQFVWWGKDRSGAVSNTVANIVASSNRPLYQSFVSGADGADEGTVAVSTILGGYDQFVNAEEVDISLLLAGKARGGTDGEQVAEYLIENIAEIRKDCVVFISPDKADVVNNIYDEITDTITFRNAISATSYAVMDNGYKKMYDRYNDLYRWIPLNGDVAGTCARTDNDRDPWVSPAGFNRGHIKNVVNLAVNPSTADRDQLYKNDINPIVNFKGQGPILYGDKTLLGKPSAFDRINVRRLFIVLEKAISTAAKFSLFEFNDEFTRAQFRNMVEPYLRTIKGRRGITDFHVVCDETNNTGDIIDRNEFVGDIYIKPARSINFIQLNFIAVGTSVEFNEIIGQF